jgi:pimeloyl-ACP methyl ester carboxylesterase
MAQLGHVSVTVDRLGYDASDPASGMQSCIGGQADIAHQIVAQLRAGRYLVPGGTPLRFARVALAGHSLGGAITQVEAYSFKDVDAVAILSFADNAATPAAVSETLGWGPLCLRVGEQSERGAPGYAHFTRSRDDFRSNFLNNAPASVVAAATPLWDLNPCGELESLAQTIAIDNVRLREIGVPVLIVAGTDDRVFSADGVRQHRNQFSGSHDVTLHLLRNATHGLTLEPTAPAFRHLLSDWLRARGF